MPDADSAVGADALVEGLPCGEVSGVAGLGIGDEMVEATPVLGDHDSTPVKGGVGGQEAERWVGEEFVEHGTHGLGCGKPLANGEKSVDAKADEEDDEGAFDGGGIATGV